MNDAGPLDPLQQADRDFCWHPFTSSDPDRNGPPLVIVRGEGEFLWDSVGRRHLDANSSIWCNLHGHAHPRLTRALREQAARIAHSSFLGYGNERASLLAAGIVAALHGPPPLGFPKDVPRDLLPRRVFFSDNGSCANEIAAKMAVQHFRNTGRPERSRLVAFEGGYHGDTMLNVSLGGVSTFSEPYTPLLLPVSLVKDEEELATFLEREGSRVAAVFLESALHGAGGLRPHRPGHMRRVAELARASGALLVLDEVLAGFGRTGHFLGCYPEHFAPDFITLSKGLTGGYLPLALTLAREDVYRSFGGDYYGGRLLYHGHTYTANPLACAVALENLAIFREEDVMGRVRALMPGFAARMEAARGWRGVAGVRYLGLIGAVEVAALRARGDRARAACLRARDFGVLTRPIGDALVVMPPYCITEESLDALFGGLRRAVEEV